MSTKFTNQEQDYEILSGAVAEKEYEVFAGIRDRATIVKAQPQTSMSLPRTQASPILDTASKSKMHRSCFFKKKPPKNKPPVNLEFRENAEYLKSQVSPSQVPRYHMNIPDSVPRFPSPTGPVGNSGFSDMTIVDENEEKSTYSIIADESTNYENFDEGTYEDVDQIEPIHKIPRILELISIPQKKNDLEWYVTNEKQTEPNSQPTEPTEDYMDMESAHDLREEATPLEKVTPKSKFIAPEKKPYEVKPKLNIELSAHINKFENRKTFPKVCPPIRKTIHHKTVHSHSLGVLRDEYQDKVPEIPKRVTSLGPSAEPLNKEKKNSGYELVPKFKLSTAKPKVDIPKGPKPAVKPKTEVRKSSVGEESIAPFRKEVLRTKSNTDLAKTNIPPISNSCQQEISSPKRLILSKQPEAEIKFIISPIMNKKPEELPKGTPVPPVRKVPPKVMDKSKSPPSQFNRQTSADIQSTEYLPQTPCERNDPGIETKADSTEPVEYVPALLEKNRRRFSDNKQKKPPGQAPKPTRANSCKFQTKQESDQKEEPMKFANELQKRLEQRKPEPNYYVPKPRY